MASNKNPIECIFICHFHHTAGPRILCQVPKDYITKDLFEIISLYAIPKRQLKNRMITMTSNVTKILGYPIRISDKKYQRNAYYFNLCIVCDHLSHTLQYQPIVKKLLNFIKLHELVKAWEEKLTTVNTPTNHCIIKLRIGDQGSIYFNLSLTYHFPSLFICRNLEIERNFLSNSDQSDDSQEQLFCMLNKVMQDLNKDNTCILTVCGAVIYLNVIKVSPDPLIPLNFDVPVLLSPINHSEHQWDLVTERISPYINGVNHVSRIVELSKLSIEIVTACIQNLIYCNAVSLVDLFRYSNMYICTTQIVQFVKNKSRHQEAINFISAANAPKAKFKDIFSMYSAMKRGARYIDICLSFNPRKLNINERNLVLYGLSNGYIRQLRKYPVLLKSSDVNKTILGNYFNGRNSLNIISCYSRSNVYTLDLAIERDKRIVSVWK